MNLRAYSEAALRWLAATAMAVATTFALVRLRRQSDRGRDGLSGAGGLVRDPGGHLSVVLCRGYLCASASTTSSCRRSVRFSSAGAQAWVAMVCFLACCLVVSRVAERARRQTQQAEQRQADVERLYALSQEMMLCEDADRLIRDLPRLIDRIFALNGVVLYVCDQDRFYASIAEIPASVQAHMQAIGAWSEPDATPAGTGIPDHGADAGIAAGGRAGWQPALLSHEVATAVSAQVAIAVARSIAIEATARIEAAREGERLRSALIDSLTHELRTPLTSIRAAATTLLETRGPATKPRRKGPGARSSTKKLRGSIC